jgi:hypothetical protein
VNRRLQRRIKRLEEMCPPTAESIEAAMAESLDRLSAQELDQMCANLRVVLLSDLCQAGIVEQQELEQLKSLSDEELLEWLDHREAEVARGDYEPHLVPVTFDEANASGAGEELVAASSTAADSRGHE